MSTYEVTVTATTPYRVTSDLSAEEVEQRIAEEIEAYGPDWPDRYDPIIRDLYAQHPRKYAAQLRELPEPDMDVDAYDSANVEVDIQEIVSETAIAAVERKLEDEQAAEFGDPTTFEEADEIAAGILRAEREKKIESPTPAGVTISAPQRDGPYAAPRRHVIGGPTH
jgi:hypothetical protein